MHCVNCCFVQTRLIYDLEKFTGVTFGGTGSMRIPPLFDRGTAPPTFPVHDKNCNDSTFPVTVVRDLHV